MKPTAEVAIEDLRKAIEKHPHRGVLASAYIWGSSLSERFKPEKSDLDVQLVLKDSEKPFESLEKVRSMCLELTKIRNLDINIGFESEVKEKVPYRPFIYEEIADSGLLIYGKDTIPRNQKLDWQDLLDALVFDAREFRRIFIADNDPNWSHIIQKDIGVFFMRLTQLAGDFQPEIEQAIKKTVEHFPELKAHEKTFTDAYFSGDKKKKIDAVMESLEILKRFCGKKARC